MVEHESFASIARSVGCTEALVRAIASGRRPGIRGKSAEIRRRLEELLTGTSPEKPRQASLDSLSNPAPVDGAAHPPEINHG